MPLTRAMAKRLPKKQTKLNFRRLSDERVSTPPLVQVLSQYQLMLMVTDHLSSADIVHLSATCKEIKTYLTDYAAIYSKIKWNAICDGKGIEARAKCFSHWKGDVTQAQTECLGKLCLPCDHCSAMVCNNCRFHITYLDDMACCRDDPEHWEFHEIDFAELVNVIRRCHHDHCGECPDFHSGNYPIEAIRAAHLAGEPRERRFCKECTPEFVRDDGISDMVALLDVLDLTEMTDDWCTCTLVDKFIDESWLCIPCFFKMEAEAYSRRSKRDVYQWERSDGELVRKRVKTEYFCDCGKVADLPLLVECRWCDEYIRTVDVDDFLMGDF